MLDGKEENLRRRGKSSFALFKQQLSDFCQPQLNKHTVETLNLKSPYSAFSGSM